MKIKESLNSIKFESLSNLEEKYGFNESGKKKFFLSGKIDSWKNILNIKQINRIEKNLEKEMKELNYLD